MFSCQRYTAATTDDFAIESERQDTLTNLDIQTMPLLPPGLVNRANYENSPGWSYGGIWFLLSASEFGKIDGIRWRDKSPAKESVSKMQDSDPMQPPLFSDEIGSSRPPIYVVAHSLNSMRKQVELAFGKPRDNSDGGNAWEWKIDLISAGYVSDIQPLTLGRPVRSVADDVPDAPVELRSKNNEPREGTTGESK